MNIQFRLALRYLSGRKMRTALTTLAIVFGVLVIFGMNIVLPTMITAIKTNIYAASGQASLTISHITGNLFDQSLVENVLPINGVLAATGKMVRTINLPKNYFDQDSEKPDRVSVLNLQGLDLDNVQSVHSFPLQDGRFLLPEDRDAVVITQSLADKISVKIGDSMRIPTVVGEKQLTIVGLLFPRTLPGDEDIFVNLPYAQEIMNCSGKINLIEANIDNFEDQGKRDEVVNAIQERLGLDFQIGTLNSNEELLGVMDMGQMILNIFGVLALFMGAFIIFNTFRTIVLERRYDIGLLRAVGASRSMITGMILIEGLIQGIIGSLAGIVSGYFLGYGILRLAQEPMSAFVNIKLGTPVVPPALVGICLLLGVSISVLSGLIPAIKAARITPLDALRPSVADVNYRKQTGIFFLIGSIFIGVGILLLFSDQMSWIAAGAFAFLLGLVCITPAVVRPFALLFGKIIARVYHRQGIGELAQGNMARHPGRTAITVSATLLGLAVAVAAGTLVSSVSISVANLIKISMGSDYLLVPPSVSLWGTNIGASADLEQKLRAVEQVDVVSSLRFAESKVNENSVSVLGINPHDYPWAGGLTFVDGSESDYDQLNDGRSMFINSIFAMTVGAKKGDVIELATTDGRKPYRVAAVVNDLLNAKVTTVFISQKNMEKDFQVTEDIFIQVNLKENADINAADAAIKTAASGYDQFTVISGKEYSQSLMNQLQTAFSGFYFLLILLAVPSLLAMLNTLSIAVIERTREIGMLRAVGATRKQIRQMMTVEGLLLAAFGTILGILGGLYLGFLFVKGIGTFMPSEYIFPLSGVLAALIIGLSFGILAAVIPSRQAARLDVIRALRYE